MEKSFSLEIRVTDSRFVTKLPEAWSVVTVIDLPQIRHEWGTVSDGTFEATMHFANDVIEFNNNVLVPLAQYLSASGIDVDFSDVDHELDVRDVLNVRNDWFKSNDKHTFVMLDNETRQAERLERKNSLARFPYRAKQITIDNKDYIVETNASGVQSYKKHTYLDLFALLRTQIENSINTTLRANRRGHVKIQLVNVSSVSVVGSAN